MNGIKTSALNGVIDRLEWITPEHYAAAGVMLEQAYQAAVWASQNSKKRK